MAKKSILVLGATGQQGGAVSRALLKKGHTLSTLTRNPDSGSAKALADLGVQVLQGDISETPLEKAMETVDSVFAMTTPFETGVESEILQGKAIANAAKTAKIKHLVYSSVASANKATGIPHFDSKYEVEKTIIGLGLPYTISAPVYFMDNLITAWNLPGLKEGKLKAGMPANRQLQQVSVKNIGEFNAALIERGDEVLGERFDYAGDTLSGEDMATVLTKATGHSFSFEGFEAE